MIDRWVIVYVTVLVDYCYFYNFMSFDPSPSSPLDSLTSLILCFPYNPSSTI